MKRIFVLTVLCLTLVTCKKEKPGEIPGPSQEKFITLNTTEALPGQLISAEANFTVQVPDTATIQVGGKATRAAVQDEKKIAFIMPVLPQGKVTIDFSALGAVNKAELNVLPYQPIDNPALIVRQFTEEVKKITVNLEAFVQSPIIQLNPKNIAHIKSLNAKLEAEFGKLTADDQKTLAYYLRSNVPDAAKYHIDSLNPGFYHQKKEGDPGERLMIVGGKFVSTMIVGVPAMMIAIECLSTPSPDPYTKGAGLAALITATTSFTLATGYALEIADLKGYSIGLDEVTQKRADVLDFMQGVEEEITVNGIFRNLIQSDKNSEVPLIRDICEGIEKLVYYGNKSIEMVNTLKSWWIFSDLEPLPSFSNPLRTESTETEMPLSASLLSIKNVSNSEIKLDISPYLSTLIIKAVSSTLTGETPFSFDIVYKDPVFAKELIKKIEARFFAKAYYLMDNANDEVITDTLLFKSDTTRTFYLSADGQTKMPAPDYPQIEIQNISNPNVKVQMDDGFANFRLTLSYPGYDTQIVSFEIKTYTGQRIARIHAKVFTPKPPVYFVMDESYNIPIGSTIFIDGKAKIFYLTENRLTPASNIDYSKIEIKNNTDASVTVSIAPSFALTLTHSQSYTKYTTFEVHYKGTKVQTIAAEVKPKCVQAPSISLQEKKCPCDKPFADGTEIYINFTCPQGDGAVLDGDYFGAYDFEYPVALEFYNAGQWAMAYNGYDVDLVSGDRHGGTIRITLTTSQQGWCCESGSLNKKYQNLGDFRVKMRDECMNWSTAVDFELGYWY